MEFFPDERMLAVAAGSRQEGMMVDDKDSAAAIAALMALTKAGIPPDVQELLVYGNASRGIKPGALKDAVKAVLLAYNSDD